MLRFLSRTQTGGSRTCQSKDCVRVLFDVGGGVFSVWTQHLTSTYFGAFVRRLMTQDGGCCEGQRCYRDWKRGI